MFTTEDVPRLIPELIDILYELPEDSTVSTVSLLRDCGFKDEDFMPVIMEIHRALFEAADAQNIRLNFVRRGRRLEGPVYEAKLRVSHGEPEEPTFESEFKQFFSREDEEERPTPLPNPLLLFARYLEIIFTNDQLWEQFQSFVRDFVPDKDNDFFAYRRDFDCIDIWREVLADRGGCFPRAFYAAVSFILLAFQDQGHDLNIELSIAHRKLND